MQRIERYGVIALVFLLVTILAVSLWGESKGGWFNWSGKDKKKEVAAAPKTLPAGQPAASATNPNGLPLSATPAGGAAPLDPNALLRDPNALSRGPGAQPVNAPLSTPSTTPIANPLGQPARANPAVGLDRTLAERNGVIAQPMDAQQHPILRGQNEAPKNVALDNASSATRKYVVKSGDTLGEIASRELGSTKRWEELSRLNGNLDPSKLVVGMTLTLPAGARSTSMANAPSKTVQPKAKVASGTSYVVKSGDTLSKIASRELGDADLWNEIVAVNPGLDPKRLKVGVTALSP